MNSFFDMGLEEHLGKETYLMKISNLLKWSKFSKILGDVHSELARKFHTNLLWNPGSSMNTMLDSNFDLGSMYSYSPASKFSPALSHQTSRLPRHNQYEMFGLDKMTEDLGEGVRVQADKGFFSEANKRMLKSKGLKNGLMHKAFRNRALTRRMKQFNKLVSKTRWRIEQCFGTIKRTFRYEKATYFSTEKVNAELLMKAMCHNLLKAVNKIKMA